MYRYKKIKKPNGKTVDEQRIIAGVEGSGYNIIVHHIDGNKYNNSKNNLLVMSRSDHCKLHGFGTNIRPTPLFIPDSDNTAICRKCNKRLAWESFVTKKHVPLGKISICKDCYNASKRKLRNERKRMLLG